MITGLLGHGVSAHGIAGPIISALGHSLLFASISHALRHAPLLLVIACGVLGLGLVVLASRRGGRRG